MQSIFINPVTDKEIIEVSSHFKSGKVTGFDKVNMNLVKTSISAIAQPLSYLINLSISTRIVPDNIKLAKILPVYKNESHSSFTKYQPISILPAFSKFFEKVMFERLVNFLNKLKILYEHQYGQS